MAIKYIDEVELEGKKVLARFDFNVPLDKNDRSKILDTGRIDLALPTIKYLISKGVKKLTLMSHLGRPKGKEDLHYSLAPVAEYLNSKLGTEIILTERPVDNGVKELLTLSKTKIVLLENLRFNPGEESNEEEFAQKLSEYGDLYVNDAFGAAHRKHASVHCIHKFFKGHAYAGFLIRNELLALDKILNSPEKPFTAIVGGAKVSDKIGTLEKLISSVDSLLIGGAMAYPFLRAKGFKIGKSLCAEEDVRLAQSLIRADKGGKIKLPVDHITSESFDGAPLKVDTIDIAENFMGLDIGPKTLENYHEIIRTSKTILWNGPMGIFENSNYSKGTFGIANACVESNAYTLVGGGDSVSAVNKSGLASRFSHISTGGGASLEYIEKGELPGISALKFGV